MPITHEIDYTRARVHVEVVGAFELKDIRATMAACMADPRLPEAFTVLSDHRRIGRPMTPQQLDGLLAQLDQAPERFRGVRWAIVSGQSGSYAMMRLLSASAELRVGMRVRVFLDLEEAERWLDSGADDEGGPPLRGRRRDG